MRGALIAVGIAVALGATAGLTYLMMQDHGDDGREPPANKKPAPVEGDVEPDQPPDLKIRAYESDRTLIEDLRDALAGDPAEVNAECWRVSGRLARDAIAMLGVVERNEASPRVRALVVIAAGVHAQDEPALFRALDDRDPRVRRASVLAIGYQPKGRAETILGVKVPIGRPLKESTRARLMERSRRESDETVRRAIQLVLG